MMDEDTEKKVKNLKEFLKPITTSPEKVTVENYELKKQETYEPKEVTLNPETGLYKGTAEVSMNYEVLKKTQESSAEKSKVEVLHTELDEGKTITQNGEERESRNMTYVWKDSKGNYHIDVAEIITKKKKE